MYKNVMKSILCVVLLSACLGGGGGGGEEDYPPLWRCTAMGWVSSGGQRIDKIVRNEYLCSTSPERDLCEIEGLGSCTADCVLVSQDCE